VSAQSLSPTATAIKTTIISFRNSNLNTLTNTFNNLRDDVYGHFYRSQNIIDDVQNNLFSAAQKFPYYSLNDASTRNQLTGNVTNFINNCTLPTIQYFNENAIVPFFNFTANNTSPMEIAFKPVSDALDSILSEVTQATNETCLNSLRINSSKLRNLFGNAANQINGCVRTTFTAYRAPINQFTNMHFTAYGQITSIVNDFQSCSSTSGNRTACAIRLSTLLCSSPTESTCGPCASVQKLKNHAISMVNQSQELLNVCLQNAQGQIEAPQQLLQDIQSCVNASTSTIKSDEEVQNNQVIDSKVDGVRQDGATTEFHEFEHPEEFDYISIY
jgi:hypothetical protein